MSTVIDLNRIPATVNTGLFAQTADSVPITNTAVETSLINGGVGTLFNTTVLNTFDITVEWGAADRRNNIYSDLFILNKTY